MNFYATYNEALETYKDHLAYTRETESYNTLIFTNTDTSIGFLNNSDIIVVFDSRTDDMIAFIERIRKIDYSKFARAKIMRKGKNLGKYAPYDYEGFLYDKGEFIEYQFYRRWWYDIARNIGGMFSTVGLHNEVERGEGNSDSKHI